MNKLVDKLFKGIDYFTGILTGLMVFFVFLNVVLRTFFNAWADMVRRTGKIPFCIRYLYRSNQCNAC